MPSESDSLQIFLHFRDLAEDLSVPWCEYWDFLEGFADLNTEEGMGSLEQYLCDVELESSSSSDDDMFDCSDILNVLEHDVENDLNSSLTMQTIQNVTLPGKTRSEFRR